MLLQEGDDDDSNFRGGANLKQWWWAHLKLTRTMDIGASFSFSYVDTWVS